MADAWESAAIKANRTCASLLPDRFPSGAPEGQTRWATTSQSAWTAGFWPGLLWELAAASGDARWARLARRWQPTLERMPTILAVDHDVGFLLMPSVMSSYREWLRAAAAGNGTVGILALPQAVQQVLSLVLWVLPLPVRPVVGSINWTEPYTPQLEGVQGFYDIVLTASTSVQSANQDRRALMDGAASLAARYSAKVGCIKSWDEPARYTNRRRPFFIVIVDSLMNLDLLLWGARAGGPAEWRDIAMRHALTTATNHVRADGSTHHIVDYNPSTGRVQARYTAQGYSNTSTWARGQSWAMNGFSALWRLTGDTRFLAVARRTSDWWLAAMARAGTACPPWDFNDPAGLRAQRDTSAAAIAACALLDLGRTDPDLSRRASYVAGAQRLLRALLQPPYLAADDSPALLANGTSNKPMGDFGTGLVYGDLYLLRAMAACADNPACVGV